MSEIVRGRTKGYMTIENFIEDGLLEIGSIDLAGFYGALKRFIDRRNDEDGKSAMPWTIDMFCKKFKIGKQRFYKLSELLWQVGLLDVEKEFGVINYEKGITGWRNRYVVHDYPDYEGPLRIVRDGSYKYKKGTAEEGNLSESVSQDIESGQKQRNGHFSEQESIDDLEAVEGEVPYRNTAEQRFGGSSNTGIPNTGIPDTGIPTAGISAAERHIKDKRSKTQVLEKTIKSNHSSNHHDKENKRARARNREGSVDNVDNPNAADLRKILMDAGFEGTEVEVEYIAVWAHIFPPEMIGHAVKKSVLNGKKSLPYIGGIFESWIKKGVRTIEQAEKETRYDLIGFQGP